MGTAERRNENGPLVNRDQANALRSLESLWRLPDGPLAGLRLGKISSEAVDEVISTLETIEVPPDTRELDRLLVAFLWGIPLFVEYQKEVVLASGGDESLYQQLRSKTFQEVERLLGLVDVDHDVERWLGGEV